MANNFIVRKNLITQQVYESPRMSLKLICEYVTATPSRRNTIIRNSCLVPTYIAKRYNLASEVITRYLAIQENDLSLLRDQILVIKSSKYKSENERSMAYSSAEALVAFLNHGNSLTSIFNGFKLEQSNYFNYHKLNIEGVEISVRPELIIRSAITNDIIGFIKLHFAKTIPLDADTANLITCLGRNYFNETHSLNLAEKNCFVIDVFRGEISSAPKSFKKRMADVVASCREIADRWYRFN